MSYLFVEYQNGPKCYDTCSKDSDCKRNGECNQICDNGQCKCKQCDNHNECQPGYSKVELYTRKCARQGNGNLYCENCQCKRNEVCIEERCVEKGKYFT